MSKSRNEISTSRFRQRIIKTKRQTSATTRKHKPPRGNFGSRCTTTLARRQVSKRFSRTPAQGSSNYRATQEETRDVFDHPPTQQTENKKTSSVSPLALVLRENPCKGFQESSSTAEDGHNWLYQFKPVPAHCILLKAPHCHLRHV